MGIKYGNDSIKVDDLYDITFPVDSGQLAVAQDTYTYDIEITWECTINNTVRYFTIWLEYLSNIKLYEDDHEVTRTTLEETKKDLAILFPEDICVEAECYDSFTTDDQQDRTQTQACYMQFALPKLIFGGLCTTEMLTWSYFDFSRDQTNGNFVFNGSGEFYIVNNFKCRIYQNIVED